jgi:hypothetical protein
MEPPSAAFMQMLHGGIAERAIVQLQHDYTYQSQETNK